MKFIHLSLFFCVVFLLLNQLSAQNHPIGKKKPKISFITPGAIWPDTKGQHIQAHGGGVIKLKNTFYWYGEQRSKGLDDQYRYVSCYSSKDLMTWTFRGNVIKMLPPDSLDNTWVLERPKVFYNVTTNKYVMYFHIDMPDPVTHRYKLAEVGVAICDKPDGKFQFVKRFRPLGCESRDIGQFIDDDGLAYLIFRRSPQRFSHY